MKSAHPYYGNYEFPDPIESHYEYPKMIYTNKDHAVDAHHMDMSKLPRAGIDYVIVNSPEEEAALKPKAEPKAPGWDKKA